MNMKIIDAEIRGNVVRFYLGGDDLKKWWGDDWNDCPYEHNCGTVYDEYVSETVDIAFPLDYYVSEPCMGVANSPYAREDFMAGNVPLVAVCKCDDAWGDDFQSVIGKPSTQTFCMGDKVEKLNGFLRISREPKAIEIRAIPHVG